MKNLSKEIMDICYAPEQAESQDEQYRRLKNIYLGISDKLNSPVRNDPAKMAYLSVISQYLFRKRNKVSINKSSVDYCAEQAIMLPRLASRFFPEIKAFLNNLEITTVSPEEFDNAVIHKIDVGTQYLFSVWDTKYFELKNFFFRLENCCTPLDLLFRGLFYARAKQNIGNIIKWAVLSIIVILILILMRVR